MVEKEWPHDASLSLRATTVTYSAHAHTHTQTHKAYSIVRR